MTGPGEEQYPVGDAAEAYLQSFGLPTDASAEAEQLSPEEVERARQEQLADQEAVTVLGRHGFALEVPEGQTTLDVSVDITYQIDDLHNSYEAQAADYIGATPTSEQEAEQLETAMDKRHAAYQTEYAALMRRGEPYYIAGKLGVYIADRAAQGRSDTEQAAEIMAAIDASDYFDDTEKQRLHAAVQEV